MRQLNNYFKKMLKIIQMEIFLRQIKIPIFHILIKINKLQLLQLKNLLLFSKKKLYLQKTKNNNQNNKII
jgi:hypothetical protein